MVGDVNGKAFEWARDKKRAANKNSRTWNMGTNLAPKTASARQERSASSKIRKHQLLKKGRIKDEQDGLAKGKQLISLILKSAKGNAKRHRPILEGQ